MFYWNGVYYTKSYDSIKVSPITGAEPATTRCKEHIDPIDHEAIRVVVQNIDSIISIITCVGHVLGNDVIVTSCVASQNVINIHVS